MLERLRVLFLSAEVAPFAKRGGLADVAGSLPKALHEVGPLVAECTEFSDNKSISEYANRNLSKTVFVSL